MTIPLIEMKNITKTFPSVTALDDVSFSLQEKEIHALVGENGAGKSTLMNVLSGVYPYGSYIGDIVFNGNICKFNQLKDSERMGIVIIHQELAMVPYLTIAENMFLGNERIKGKGVIDWQKTYQDAEQYMEMIGLHESAHTLVKDIGVGKQQMVEIAKALAKNVKLLILDEPTSALNESDARHLLDLLLDFKKNRGISSIIISHKLDEVVYVADKITIIRDGMTIETLDRSVNEFTEPRIVTGMVGRKMEERYPHRTPAIQDIALEVENWDVYHPLYNDRKVVDDVSFHAHKGEVVGIAGLIGAGRTELCQSLFGKVYGTKISGVIKIKGEPVRLDTVSQAISAGIAYVTEDRKSDGLVLKDSVQRNITLASLEKIQERGVLNFDKECQVADEYVETLSIKTPSIDQFVENLSGGNQQKVLLAKWIYAQPDILLLDEPTRGIDVGSKYEIYCIIDKLAAEGKCICMVSSELPELLGMCDRVYVMCEGRIIGELQRSEATQEIIMDMILQASKRETNS
ncbi:xylose ABC transporter ATP-binding protein [Clostridia bacterium]|nr:xylose ABC transporter ATP-binding protein [Clostridia bacterium]